MARLHEAQIDLPDALVRSLVDSQFPQWRELPLRPVSSVGTIHRIDRLGDEFVVRLPFIDWAVEDVAKDSVRLPMLAAALPVEVPQLVGRGVPAEGMPWHWGVYRWLEGRHATPGDDDAVVAAGLADAVLALRSLPPAGDPSPAAFLAARDNDVTRPKVVELGSPAALAAWDAAVSLGPEPATASAWVHGDLMPGNVLLRDGSVSAIIDWGASGVGDPALDLLAAWTCFGPTGRAAYLGALEATQAQATLARALAVRKVAWGLPYYRDTNPGFAAAMAHTLAQIEADTV